ncbi:MAG: septation protein A [Methylobacillus sp.]|nr:septation protein A [Methylobacillus sp.]
MKFLFDLFPVLLFFLTYKLASHGEKTGGCLITQDVHASLLHEPILLATAVAIAATFLQVGWLLLRRKPIEKMLWASLGIIVIFGGATLYFRDPTFIQWKPTILYWCIACFLLFASTVLKKNMIRASMETQISLPDMVWAKMNISWIVFFIALGFANIVAFKYLDCNDWVSFKAYGLIGLSFVFVIIQTIAISKYIKDK